uniref:L1 transposable element RRM domain-containing protein n=1 Tax=Seriola dumerili TaxID=41447 RepID=A0A3B4T4C2_SERDU
MEEAFYPRLCRSWKPVPLKSPRPEDMAEGFLQCSLGDPPEKTDNLENRSRRSNIRILNVPEQAEGRDAAGFLEKFIPEILGNDNFTSPITLERAHRIGKKSDRPRQEKVLCLARNKGEMTYENKKISFYPDYSADLQRRRGAFLDVKRMLREKEVEYALIYPAQLRIKHLGSVKFFPTPVEVQRFLKDLPKTGLRRNLKEYSQISQKKLLLKPIYVTN